MKRLIWWGTLLFLLGLLTGLLLAMAPGVADNPRGVLAGHIAGVLQGMFLIIVGLMADRVRLSTRATTVCAALLLYAAFPQLVHVDPRRSRGEPARRCRLQGPGIMPPRAWNSSF